MTGVEVLMACRCALFEVRVTGDELQLEPTSPTASLTPELHRELLVHKAEILELLGRADRVDELQRSA